MSSSKHLTTLGRVVSHLSAYDGEMNLHRVTVFLTVARKDGCLVKDLVKVTGLNQSSVARLLAVLGEKPTRGATHPLRWVELRPDEEDPRRVRCWLTPKGQKVIEELSELMQ